MGGTTSTGEFRVAATQERQDIKAEGCLTLKIKGDIRELKKGRWILVDGKKRELIYHLINDNMGTLSKSDALGVITDTMYHCVKQDTDYSLFAFDSSGSFKSSDQGYAHLDKILEEGKEER